MPAKEIMVDFKAHDLHSGSPDGPIVTNPHQAKAIQLSYLRKEGHDIPMKRKSLYRHAYKMRQMEHREMGGPVEAGGDYMVGEGGPERFVPHTDGTIVPNKITGPYNPSPGMSHPAGKIL